MTPVKELTLNVKEIITETPDTKTIRLHLSEPFPFIPGQWVVVTVNIPDKANPEKRAYSISSSPSNTDYLDLTVKKEPEGIVSTYLVDNLKLKSTLKIKGPFGKFIYDQKAKEISLVGAGSGIAPLRSILQFILHNKQDTLITLFFSVRTTHDIIFKNEFEELSKHHKNFKYIQTVTQPDSSWKGLSERITADLISQHTANPDLFFLCGPPKMVDSVKHQLEQKGVDTKKIRTEKY